MEHKKYFCEDGSLNYSHPHIEKYHYSQWIGDVDSGEPHHGYKPSIFMPKWASRLTLQITDIRVERLQGISQEDAIAEGCRPYFDKCNLEYLDSPNGGKIEMMPLKSVTEAYQSLWESLNGAESWDANPWVWVLEFKVHHKNVGELLK